MPSYSKKHAEQMYQKYLKEVIEDIGNETTNSMLLLKTGKKMFGEKFRGVYSSDKVPVLSNKQSIIVNLDEAHEKGSHWVSISRDGNKSWVYDSFGRNTWKILPKMMNSEKNGMIKMTEKDAEQNEKENNCGQRCLAAIKIFNEMGGNALKHI